MKQGAKARGGRQRGFTLIELTVVITILGILAAIAIDQYRRHYERVKIAKAISAARCLVTAFGFYAGRHPQQLYPTWIASHHDLWRVATHNGCRFRDLGEPMSYPWYATYCYERDEWGLIYPRVRIPCPPFDPLLPQPMQDMEVQLMVPDVERSPGQEVMVIASTADGVSVIDPEPLE